ncbi:MAG: alpha/beta fold hydrolase [Pseudomonadota bacterium]
MLSYSTFETNAQSALILYLHGLGMAGWCWEPVRQALPDFGSLVPDLPGHGGSARQAWRSISDTAAAVAEVVDTVPADRPVFVVGHSLGAYVGLNLLVQRPQRFRGAVLSGFHTGHLPKPRLFKLAYLANSIVFRVPFLVRRFSSVLGNADLAERFVDGAKVIKPRTIRRAGIQVVDYQPPSAAEVPSVPILAIAGDREPDAIRSTPARLEAEYPNARGLVLEGCDHLWPVREPMRYAQIVGEHCADGAPKLGHQIKEDGA